MKELLQLSSAKLQRIVALKRNIERLQARLESLLNDTPATTSARRPQKQRRKLSAAARKKISAAAKARWAKYRAMQK
jgi:hypothetical protein